MQILNHLPERPDGANLWREFVAANVRAITDDSRRLRHGVTSPEAWQPIRERWLTVYRESFPPELFAMHQQPVQATTVARYEREQHIIETVRFQSFWGWEVNAHLCLPRTPGPWPAVVLPNGHGAKFAPEHQVPPVVFAQHGFAAITFDPPGMGEKALVGNDHFNQGVACLLTGLWTETFFVMDALRAIDYLASRDDIDLSPGVGMTGVSGGGETTIACALLDERIRCIAPVCCTVPQQVLGVDDGYSSCPEIIGPGHLAAGIDLTEKLALLAPLPCLIVNAGRDFAFTPEKVSRLVNDLRPSYMLYGCQDRFAHFTDHDAQHDYTVRMADEVAGFMRRWLLGETAVTTLDSERVIALEPDAVLACVPDPTRTIMAINSERVAACAAQRAAASPDDIRVRMTALLQPGAPSITTAQVLTRDTMWTHRLERLALTREDGFPLPSILVARAEDDEPRPLLLWIDDRGKWNALTQEPWLYQAAGQFRSDERYPHLCLTDVRGMGETAPEHVPYDYASSWNDITRILSYLHIGLGCPVMGQRVGDVLAVLAYLRTLANVDASQILLGGYGSGALVALYAALLDEQVAGFIGSGMLTSYADLTTCEPFAWPHDIIIPGLLAVADIPDIVRALGRPALLLNPVDARRQPGAFVSDESYVSVVQPATEADVIATRVLPWLHHVARARPLGTC